NSQWLQKLSPAELAREAAPFVSREVGRDVAADPKLPAVAALYQKRAKTLVELGAQAAFFFRRADEIVYDPAARAKFLTPENRPVLEKLLERLSDLPAFAAADIEPVFAKLVLELGVKMV